ncbi:hypertrehalosaemic prohormone [Anopheles aquasalis]|uniref:Putative adipokinetic hormone-like protein n=2 Tax=Nyssorhynchus TaxID=44543 RepID=A0A158N7M0_ANODA|nr:hypertrehalosaemic prohormone [Anopheles darlingi]XP_050089589.1 hypertrehalosaemic prohormone [Anopheles aquasalis]
MDNVKLFSVLLICVALMLVCEAQLTFTPAWGKRSPGSLTLNPLIGSTSYGQDACKTPVDSLLVIYRMIQTEAQKIVDCSQK